MTIRFAAARRGDSCVDHVLGRAALLPAANDNVRTPNDDRMLRAALHHFAAHGLGAAEAARENAETAFFAGDREQYRWWLGICRMLDRRMADAVRVRREAAQ
ncbi:MAG: hypothetical protein EOO76_02260 [Novosphingobium sp.]|nr:MAG: hypothetical protein EOO76_02260 [Novosphingobium sp.]